MDEAQVEKILLDHADSIERLVGLFRPVQSRVVLLEQVVTNLLQILRATDPVTAQKLRIGLLPLFDKAMTRSQGDAPDANLDEQLIRTINSYLDQLKPLP